MLSDRARTPVDVAGHVGVGWAGTVRAQRDGSDGAITVTPTPRRSPSGVNCSWPGCRSRSPGSEPIAAGECLAHQRPDSHPGDPAQSKAPSSQIGDRATGADPGLHRSRGGQNQLFLGLQQRQPKCPAGATGVERGTERVGFARERGVERSGQARDPVAEGHLLDQDLAARRRTGERAAGARAACLDPAQRAWSQHYRGDERPAERSAHERLAAAQVERGPPAAGLPDPQRTPEILGERAGTPPARYRRLGPAPAGARAPHARSADRRHRSGARPRIRRSRRLRRRAPEPWSPRGTGRCWSSRRTSWRRPVPAPRRSSRLRRHIGRQRHTHGPDRLARYRSMSRSQAAVRPLRHTLAPPGRQRAAPRRLPVLARCPAAQQCTSSSRWIVRARGCNRDDPPNGGTISRGGRVV